jgi:membrane protease YdiL (CAAX protease family)
MALNRTDILAAFGFCLVYGLALWRLDGSEIYPLEEAITVLLIIGLGFSAIGFVLTRGLRPRPLMVRQPMAETIAVLSICVGLAVFLVIGPQLTEGLAPSGSALAYGITLARKLTVFVAIPYLIFHLGFRYRWQDLGLSVANLKALGGRQGVTVLVMALVICGFQFMAGSGAAPIRNGQISGAGLWLGLPLSFIWLMAEVGLVEEFFFRVLLLERLVAVTRSPIAGLVMSTTIFGLMHAPGYVLRGAGGIEAVGAHPDWLTAISYAVAVPGIAGIFLSVLWLRTRNLWVVILIHAAVDLLPGLGSFNKAFGIV